MKKIMAAALMLLLINVAGCGSKASGQENSNAADQGKLVTVITVQKQGNTVTLPAMAVAEAKQEANMSFSASGTITALYAAKGMKVGKGQLLATLDTGTAETRVIQQIRLEDAVREFDNKKADLQRVQNLYANGAVSRVEVENLQREIERAASGVAQARQNQSEMKLIAPFSGIIVEVNQQAGETFIPGKPLIRLMDLSEIKLTMDVPGDLINQYSTGQTAGIVREGGQTVQGRITHISPATDTRTGKYRVEVTVNNAGEEWRGGMLARVEVPRKLATGIVLPLSCVGIDRDKRYVLALENGVARRREVQVGQIIGDSIEIQSGVHSGDQVISAGIAYIVEGEKVIAKENGRGENI